MRRIITAATAIVFMLCAISVVYTERGMCNVVWAEEGEIINETCPVMGGKVDKDTPYKTEYKGKIIGFCCPSCVAKFNENPEKYVAKLKIKKKCIIKCPQCGAEIDVMKECEKAGNPCPMVCPAEKSGR